MNKSCFFCLALLLVGTLAQAQSDPVPFLNQPLVPTSVAPGGPAFTLTVNGIGFASTSVIDWNGTPLQTVFVNDSQLTATVPSASIANPATATITVVSPSPGGGTSNVEFFPISSVTTPTFTNYAVPTPPTPHEYLLNSPVAIDVNGDGKLDVIGGYFNQMVVLIGNGDGSFQPPSFFTVTADEAATAGQVSLGDFNNDGKLDVALGFSGSNLVVVVLGKGDGTFGGPTDLTLQTGYEADYVQVADVNKDGKLDLLTGNNLQPDPVTGAVDATLSVFLGNGDGTFQSPVNYQIGNYMDSMTVGDLNGDGNLDGIASTSEGIGLGGVVLLGNGDGTFGSPMGVSVLPASQMALADINGDGKLDLLAEFETLEVYLGNGDGTFLPGVSYGTAGGNPTLSVGDFNADGKLDAAMAANISKGVSIFYGNGDGTFQPEITYPTSTSTSGDGAANGDFNGDGRLDLFFGPQNGNTLGTVLLQGSFPLLSPTPGSLTFPQQTIKTTSLAQTVTLTNSGNAGLTISKIGLIGTNEADYAETNNCGATLAVNATCQVSITFTPTAQGTRSAMLSISDNAPGTPQSIGLTGATPPAAALTLSPASITFPNQFVGTTGLPQTVTATNTGDAPLTITSVATSSKSFGVLNACGDSLAAGASCSIGVFFDPASSGSNTGTVTIADNASGSPQTVALSGMGQDFSFSATSSTSTITPGQTANYTIAVNPIAGFNQTVVLNCSGAPAGSTCSLSSNSATLTGSSPTSVTVSVTTIAASVRRSDGSRPGDRTALYLSLCGFPGLILWGACKRRWGPWKSSGVLGLVFLAVIVVGTNGCGGSSGGGTGGTPANTYSLTVTGTFASGSANLTHSTNLTLVVQ